MKLRPALSTWQWTFGSFALTLMCVWLFAFPQARAATLPIQPAHFAATEPASKPAPQNAQRRIFTASGEACEGNPPESRLHNSAVRSAGLGDTLFAITAGNTGAKPTGKLGRDDHQQTMAAGPDIPADPVAHDVDFAPSLQHDQPLAVGELWSLRSALGQLVSGPRQIAAAYACRRHIHPVDSFLAHPQISAESGGYCSGWGRSPS